MEVVFEIRDAEEGGYFARAVDHAIFTEAETWAELRDNIVEATSLHFEDDLTSPRVVHLRYFREELLPLVAA